MTGLSLPALDGRTPLGFLAALGVLRLVDRYTSLRPRLSWSTADATAVLHEAHTDLDQLVADLAAVVAEIPDGGVLPGMPADFPPPGEAPDRLRLRRRDFRRYAEDRTGNPVADPDGEASTDLEAWLASLVTDLSLDDKDRTDITLFAAPSGKQSMRTMLEKPLERVRAQPDLLREALVGWRRYPGVTGEYLDHRVLFDAVDAPDGKPAERGVPGATWLALMAYPLLRTTATGGQPMTTCWQDTGDRRDPRRMVYPLWSEALDLPAVTALLGHEILLGTDPGPPPMAAELLSVFWIGHAHRRRIPGRNFAGVLAPVREPVRKPVRKPAFGGRS